MLLCCLHRPTTVGDSGFKKVLQFASVPVFNLRKPMWRCVVIPCRAESRQAISDKVRQNYSGLDFLLSTEGEYFFAYGHHARSLFLLPSLLHSFPPSLPSPPSLIPFFSSSLPRILPPSLSPSSTGLASS